ncbi:MAG TPA: cytochrome P450 [Myxococcota bacterium]|nr:cytochrome P450 [Myxococcota bacterium]
MDATLDKSNACPLHGMRSDSKTAALAAESIKPEPGSRWIRSFGQARELLRHARLRQSGVEAAPVEKEDPTKASIFFLDGDAHRERRAAIARFFTPRAIATRHMRVIQENTENLVAELRRDGRARLDDLSLRMAGAVIAEIVGLTSRDVTRMAKRIEGASRAAMAQRGGLWKLLAAVLARVYALQVLYLDVRPAIAARRAARQEDVISRLLDEGRSDVEILVESLTFGLAGMTTTREFIVVAAWHLFDNEELRRRFLDGNEADQHAILTEILRLEPVASMIWRDAAEEVVGITPETIAAGTRLSFDLRAANLDETEVGPCPLSLDPDRSRRLKSNGAYMSFGDGEHFCPGWQVALAETRVFLDRLFRVPGIRLVRAPDMHFVPPMLMSYELRNAVIACDRG